MEDKPSEPQKPIIPVKRSSVSKRIRQKSRTKKIVNAGRWILFIAIAFAIFGTVLGFMAQKEANKALLILSDYEDSEVWPVPVEGETYTVGQLEKKVQMGPRLVFVTNYVLAAIMLGIFFWSRKSPLPATTTALCIYLAVIVLNAVIDPSTLWQGWLIKILFIGAMVGGIKAGLAQQAQLRAEEPSPELADETS